MADYRMVIKPAPRTPRRIRERLKHIWIEAIGSWLMKSKGLKYIPAIIIITARNCSASLLNILSDS